MSFALVIGVFCDCAKVIFETNAKNSKQKVFKVVSGVEDQKRERGSELPARLFAQVRSTAGLEPFGRVLKCFIACINECLETPRNIISSLFVFFRTAELHIFSDVPSRRVFKIAKRACNLFVP